jgi:hypothetical protein
MVFMDPKITKDTFVYGVDIYTCHFMCPKPNGNVKNSPCLASLITEESERRVGDLETYYEVLSQGYDEVTGRKIGVYLRTGTDGYSNRLSIDDTYQAIGPLVWHSFDEPNGRHKAFHN